MKENSSMANFDFTDDTYPNGTRFQQVSLNGVVLGHLVEAEAGYTALGWRKPVASKDAALEKMRAAGVAERKRQIASLQAEIDKLAAA
jgi:hypothetical protein